MKITFLKRYVLLVGVVWSIACVAALVSHFQDDYAQSLEQVQIRAATMLERDVLYRDWVARHGGVYVPTSDFSPPNPHLGFLPDRDITLADGRQLTLINPSYMTHQAFEMDNRLGVTVSKITSLKFLNPANAPDTWERQALLSLEQGQGDELVSDVVEKDGRSYGRFMRPFHVEENCLECHASQGYQVGDLRGGLSITIPFESFISGRWPQNLTTVGLFFLLWVVGLIGVVLLGRKLYTQTCLAIESGRLLDHAEMSLEFISNYNRRTNLPNRFKFEEHLDALFHRLSVKGGSVAVIALEIRNYKQIIDNFEFPVGDVLFKMMAERLAVLLTADDTVAHYGEDRLLFSYISPNGDPIAESDLQKFLDHASKPLVLEGHEFFPVVCLGAAVCPAGTDGARHVVQKSISTLNFCLEGKQTGGMLYSHALRDFARNRLDLESGLRAALAESDFELYLQAQVNPINGQLLGAEALLRWNKDGQGYISPEVFIPVAEESGLILPLGEWVLQTATLHALKLRERFGRIIPVAVNVSARQFQDASFISIIDEVLSIDGVSPDMLEIEITESTFIEDIDKTIEILTDLKVRGLKIAIDDFGTGYSSLIYLKRFPIDRLKIDRSFISDIADNDEDRILVSLITELGSRLGLEVVAEGVENETQKNLLIGMGCPVVQGFLFGRPVPLDELCALSKTEGHA